MSHGWGIVMSTLAVVGTGCGYRPGCDFEHEVHGLEEVNPDVGRSGADLLSPLEGEQLIEVLVEPTGAEGWSAPDVLEVSIEGLGPDAEWFVGTNDSAKWFHTTHAMMAVSCGSGLRLPVSFTFRHPQTGTRIEGEGSLSTNDLIAVGLRGEASLSATLPMEALRTDIDWTLDLPPSEGEEGQITGDRFEFEKVVLDLQFVDGVLLSGWVSVGYDYRETYRGRRYPHRNGWATVLRIRGPGERERHTGLWDTGAAQLDTQER